MCPLRRDFATGVTVDPGEGIIDDTCLVEIDSAL